MHGPRNGVPANLTVQVRLDEEMYRAIAEAAARDERSMGHWVRRVIAERLSQTGPAS